MRGPAAVESLCIPLTAFIEELTKQMHHGVVVIFFDACRENPMDTTFNVPNTLQASSKTSLGQPFDKGKTISGICDGRSNAEGRAQTPDPQSPVRSHEHKALTEHLQRYEPAIMIVPV